MGAVRPALVPPYRLRRLRGDGARHSPLTGVSSRAPYRWLSSLSPILDSRPFSIRAGGSNLRSRTNLRNPGPRDMATRRGDESPRPIHRTAPTRGGHKWENVQRSPHSIRLDRTRIPSGRSNSRALQPWFRIEPAGQRTLMVPRMKPGVSIAFASQGAMQCHS